MGDAEDGAFGRVGEALEHLREMLSARQKAIPPLTAWLDFKTLRCNQINSWATL